jgi:hypothetical protein
MNYPFPPAGVAYSIIFSMLYVSLFFAPIALLFYFNKSLRSLLTAPDPKLFSQSESSQALFEFRHLPTMTPECFHSRSSGPMEIDKSMQLSDSSNSPVSNEFSVISRAILSFFRRRYPEAEVSLETMLIDELGMSDVQIIKITKAILYATGREVRLGAFHAPVTNIEDIVSVVITTPYVTLNGSRCRSSRSRVV